MVRRTTCVSAMNQENSKVDERADPGKARENSGQPKSTSLNMPKLETKKDAHFSPTAELIAHPFEILEHDDENPIISTEQASDQPSMQDTKSKSATYINTCFSCKYDIPESQQNCKVCKGGKKPPKSKPYLHATSPVPQCYSMPASTLVWISTCASDNEAVQAHIKAFAKSFKGSCRADKDFPGRRQRLVLLEATEGTPRIVLTAAQDSCPSIDLNTWDELGCPQFPGIELDVCVPTLQPRKNKHSRTCECRKCGRALLMNANAMLVMGTAKVDGQWSRREKRVWWLQDHSEAYTGEWNENEKLSNEEQAMDVAEPSASSNVPPDLQDKNVEQWEGLRQSGSQGTSSEQQNKDEEGSDFRSPIEMEEHSEELQQSSTFGDNVRLFTEDQSGEAERPARKEKGSKDADKQSQKRRWIRDVRSMFCCDNTFFS